MVRIRLARMGAKKQPYYRVVVQENRSPRDSKFIEMIGNYNPRTDPPTIEIDAERALYWLGVGAQPSEAVRRMFDKLGILSQVAARQSEPATQPAAAPPLTTGPLELEELPPTEEDEEFEVDMFEGEEPEEQEGEWEVEPGASDDLDLDDEDWEAELDDTDDDTDDDDDEDEDDQDLDDDE